MVRIPDIDADYIPSKKQIKRACEKIRANLPEVTKRRRLRVDWRGDVEVKQIDQLTWRVMKKDQ